MRRCETRSSEQASMHQRAGFGKRGSLEHLGLHVYDLQGETGVQTEQGDGHVMAYETFVALSVTRDSSIVRM